MISRPSSRWPWRLLPVAVGLAGAFLTLGCSRSLIEKTTLCDKLESAMKTNALHVRVLEGHLGAKFRSEPSESRFVRLLKAGSVVPVGDRLPIGVRQLLAQLTAENWSVTLEAYPGRNASQTYLLFSGTGELKGRLTLLVPSDEFNNVVQ